MKRKDVPDLQEALDKRWCYYCERIFQDDLVLCEHQRIKHFRCDWDEQYSCGKKFTTAGGLSVHMSQVHKSKLEKIQNTIEGRENPAVEIFGMLGIPQELLDAHRREIETQYYQAEAEHRARTGNPLRGPNPNAGSHQRMEVLTHEEKMAKIEAHRAKNRANKAAREAGYKDAEDQARQLAEQNNGTRNATYAATDDASTVGTSHMSAPQPQNPPYMMNGDAFGAPYGHMQGFQPPPQHSMSMAASPTAPNSRSHMPGFQPPPPYSMPMSASPLGPGPQFAPPPHGPGASATPGPEFFNNGYMVTNAPHGNNGFFAAPPYAQSDFNGPMPGYSSGAPQPPTTWPSRAAALPPSTISSLPPAPGLPARPSFNSLPNFTREEMAQLHGAGQSQPGVNVHKRNNMPVALPTNGSAADNKQFSASLVDMIKQEAQNAQHKVAVEQASVELTPPVATPPAAAPPKSHSKKSKSKRDNQVLKVNNEVVSPEELKAADRKFTNIFTARPPGLHLSAASSSPWYHLLYRDPLFLGTQKEDFTKE